MGIFQKKKVSTSMESEIRQQPEILESILKDHVAPDGFIILNAPAEISKIVLVASGSSYHCARFAAEIFGEIANIEARVIYSSEFLLKKVVPHDENVLYIFITQSGETTDTLSALNKAKQLGIKTMCVTNRENSTAWNSADFRINCQAGEEKSIASTKALTAQMLCLYLLAIEFAQQKELDTKGRLENLKKLPQIVKDTLAMDDKIKSFARFLSKYRNILLTAD